MVGIYGRSITYNKSTKKYEYILSSQHKNSVQMVLAGYCFISKVIFIFFLLQIQFKQANMQTMDVLVCLVIDTNGSFVNYSNSPWDLPLQSGVPGKPIPQQKKKKYKGKT